MLNIAKYIQVGWKINTSQGALPEADITPIGDSVKEIKSLTKITAKNDILKEYENIPLPGFTLLKTKLSSYSTGDKGWAVIDPRGYTCIITSKNLQDILTLTGITEGLIQDKCVWAREDSDTKMSLIPVSSPRYVEAIQNTTLIDEKVDIGNVSIGDIVFTQTGVTGEYMGVVSLYGPAVYSDNRTLKPQVFLRRHVIKIEPGKYFYQHDPKILKIVNKTTMTKTREDSVMTICKDIAAGNSFFSTSARSFSNNGGYYSTRHMITHASVHAVPKLKMKLEEINLQDAISLYHKGQMRCDDSLLVIERQDGKQFIVDHSMSIYSQNLHSINGFDVLGVANKLNSEFETVQLTTDKEHSWGRPNTTGSHALDRFKKFYKIVKCVKKETYV